MPESRPPTSAEPGSEDPLEQLRERVRATQEAAERLAEEARRPPPRGYEAPRDSGRRDDTLELAALTALVEAVRGLIPRELQQQLLDLVRELLLALRALIDFYLERIESRRRAPVEVEDIPID